MRKAKRRLFSRAAKGDIDKLARVMKRGEPTPFCYESDAIMLLRSQRCLDGWRYERADEEARAIVVAALNRIGAVRPSWLDGQRYVTAYGNGKTCIECGIALYGPYELVHCSLRCRFKTQNRHRIAERAEGRNGMTCQRCGKPLDAKRNDEKWCGPVCRNAAWQERSGYTTDHMKTEHTCIWCGSTFTRYATASRTPKFCSTSCGTRWRWAQRGDGPKPLQAKSAEARVGLLIR